MIRLRNVEYLASTSGGSQSAATTDWANLVVANGGAMPSKSTLSAVDTWYKALVAAGIDSLMINVGFFAPDNRIAALTPFFHTAGLSLWTNTGTQPLTTSGLATAVGESVLQNVNPTGLFTTGDMGLTCWTKAASGAPVYAYGGGDGSHWAQLWGSNEPDEVASYATWNINVTNPSFASGSFGWFSANRTATNLVTAYCANGSVPFGNFGSSAGASGAVPNATGTSGIGWNSPGVAAGISQGATLSFMGCHHGLTSTQAQAFFNATLALRQAFGGGFN